MDVSYLRIADFVIKINFFKNKEFPNSIDFFKQKMYLLQPYLLLSSQKYDFELTLIYRNNFDTLIDKKRKKHLIGFYEEKTSNHFISYYHISSEQLLIIVRDIIQKLLQRDKGIFVHGSAAIGKLNDKGVIFLGQSGAGKSTIINLIKSEYIAIADDIFIIKEIAGKYYIYQTPFIQKNKSGNQQNERILLSSIFILKKGKEEKKVLIHDVAKIFSFISNQSFTDLVDNVEQIKFILKLSVKVKKVYILTFSLHNREEL